jgi:hypothetical protein
MQPALLRNAQLIERSFIHRVAGVVVGSQIENELLASKAVDTSYLGGSPLWTYDTTAPMSARSNRTR